MSKSRITTIASEVLSREEILDEEPLNYTRLSSIVNDTWCLIRFLARHRLIKNRRTCPKCGNVMAVITRSDIKDLKMWNCGRCKYRSSIRQGSMFHRAHFPLKKIILIIYCWSRDSLRGEIIFDSDCNNESVVYWTGIVKDICVRWVNTHGRKVKLEPEEDNDKNNDEKSETTDSEKDKESTSEPPVKKQKVLICESHLFTEKYHRRSHFRGFLKKNKRKRFSFIIAAIADMYNF